MPRWRNPLAALFSRPRREEYLAHGEEHARLLERPDVVAAIGKQVIAEIRAGRVAQQR